VPPGAAEPPDRASAHTMLNAPRPIEPANARSTRVLGGVQLLVLDDWGPEPLTSEQARDLLEIVEDRYDAGSVLITSQVPVDRWYEMIGSPTLADAVLDRLVHNAYRIELSGDSLRKQRPIDQPA